MVPIFTDFKKVLFYNEYPTDSDEESDYDFFGDFLVDSEDVEVNLLTQTGQLVKPTPKRIPAHSMKQNQPLKSSLLKNKFEPELQFVLSFENYIQCTSNLIFLNTFE